jgi:hypothetical protein
MFTATHIVVAALMLLLANGAPAYKSTFTGNADEIGCCSKKTMFTSGFASLLNVTPDAHDHGHDHSHDDSSSVVESPQSPELNSGINFRLHF